MRNRPTETGWSCCDFGKDKDDPPLGHPSGAFMIGSIPRNARELLPNFAQDAEETCPMATLGLFKFVKAGRFIHRPRPKATSKDME